MASDPIVELITSAIPVSPDDGCTVIEARDDGGITWGHPSTLAALIRDKLTESGHLLPSGGEVSNSPRGLGNIEYARRIADRLYRDLWQSKPRRKGTAEHARVLIEQELDAIAAEIWGSPVLSDNSEASDG